MEKGKIAQHEQFHLFLQLFFYAKCTFNPLITTFPLSSAFFFFLIWDNKLIAGSVHCHENVRKYDVFKNKIFKDMSVTNNIVIVLCVFVDFKKINLPPGKHR